ncbi:uncharacterized protein LOC142345592 isoform X2 [Convolutriloba macropyga]|uniref:uncharacterized protein LOC142345592 isoform X2 n=1 Tax=Convolutriloba macropyga TaxID=536237 RepID=UPI003F51C16C
MTKILEVSEENLDDLLAYDDTFLDYFNSFLSSGAFPIPLYYDRLTGTIHEVDIDTSASVEHQPAKYGPNDEERERVFNWVKNDRLPLFLTSRFYLEYKLSKHLVRTLEVRRASTYSGLGGYSRQTRSDSTSTFMNSASKNSTAESNEYEHETNAWPEIRYSAFKYLRPGSRAFSLPISIMRGKRKRDGFYDSDSDSDSSPVDVGRNNENVSAAKHMKNGEPKSILKSGGNANKKSVQLSSTDKNPSSKKTEDLGQNGKVGEIEALKLPSTSNKSKHQNEEEQFYDDLNVEDFKSDLDAGSENNRDENEDEEPVQSGKSSVFEKSASNVNNRLLTGKARKVPNLTDLQDEDTMLRNGAIKGNTSSRFRRRTTAHKRRTVLQQLKEEFLSTREGLNNFKKFLTTTENGKDLVEFWVEVEQFKDELEQIGEFGEDRISGKQFRQIFREIMNKYNLSRETKEQIRKSLQNDGFSLTVFMRTQYDILRRIRTYWIPRYLEHMEHTEGIRIPSSLRLLSMDTKSKPSSTAGVTTVTERQSANELTENDPDFTEYEPQNNPESPSIPDKLQDFSIHPYVDVSKTLPLKPDENIIRIIQNPLKTWSEVAQLSKSQVSRVKSGLKRTPEEWTLALQPREDFFIKSLENDKFTGGPFFRYLQKQCLNSTSSEQDRLHMKNLAKFLFWQDAKNFGKTAHLYSNQHIKSAAAWNIFNKYFNPLSLWFIEIAHSEIELMRVELQNNGENLNKNIFEQIADKIVTELEKSWIKYNKEDLQTFLIYRGQNGTQLLTRFATYSGIRLEDIEPKIRKYPGSTESQIKQRVQREKAKREKELEVIEQERRRLRSEERNRIRAERKRYLEDQKRRLHEVMTEVIADNVAHIEQSRPIRTRDSENRRVAEAASLAKRKANKKQKAKSAWLQTLTLNSTLEDESLSQKFTEYLFECERSDASNKIKLSKDLGKFFELTKPDEKENLGMEIVNKYMRRESVCKIDLPRKLIIREVRPQESKLQAVLEYVQPEVEEYFEFFKQGLLYLNRMENSKKPHGNQRLFPPIWNKRKIDNGLVDDDQEMPAKMNPSADDKEMLKTALDRPQEERMLAMLHSFFKHLQRCVKGSDCHPLLPKGLIFCFEVSRLRELIHQNNDPPALSRKIETIIEVFLEGQIEPRIQLDIPVDLVVRISKQGHFFAKNEQYSEISGFVDAYEKIYKQLCPYFAAFFKHYKPPPMLEKNPQKHKMLRLMDLEMQKRHEEWRGRCATPQFEYNLPKLPVKLKQNVKGVQVSFSFQEGIRAKALDALQVQIMQEQMRQEELKRAEALLVSRN